MVEGNGVRLHYLEWPSSADREDGPSLPFRHGTSSNALFWSRTVWHLHTRHSIALDLRGHGRSERPPWGYSAETMASDCAHALTGLGLNRPLVVGHSWGLAVALEIAATRPELVGGSVLVDGPIASISDCVSREEADRQMRPPPAHYRSIAEAEDAQASFLREAWGDDLRAFVRAGLTRADSEWVPVPPERGRFEMMQQLYDFRPERLLSRLRGSVLIAMATDGSDGVAPDVVACWRRKAPASARLCPTAELRAYDSRHDIPLIRPAELAADVERTPLLAKAASAKDQASC